MLIECGRPDDKSVEAAEPRVVVEILSPSTTRYDRFQKLEEYKQHAKIRVVLIVDTEAPQGTVWRRGQAGDWTYHEEVGLDATIALPEIEADLPLAELYRNVTFDKP